MTDAQKSEIIRNGLATLAKDLFRENNGAAGELAAQAMRCINSLRDSDSAKLLDYIAGRI